MGRHTSKIFRGLRLNFFSYRFFMFKNSYHHSDFIIFSIYDFILKYLHERKSGFLVKLFRKLFLTKITHLKHSPFMDELRKVLGVRPIRQRRKQIWQKCHQIPKEEDSSLQGQILN